MPVAKLIKIRKGVMRLNTKIGGIKAILISAIVTGTICMPFRTYAQPSPVKNTWVVVIDAGHGGKDPGSIGYSKSKEKNLTLAVALKTGKYIEDNLKDVRVIYTRDDDTFLGLDERADVANRNKADIFISIHANAIDDKRPSGAETWVLGQSMDDANLKVAMKENSAITYEDDYKTKYEGYDPNSVESFIIFSLMQNTYLKQSTEFASIIQNQLRDRVGRKDRGVKQAGFVVLWRTTMPSVLVEVGFITNSEEEKYLLSDEGQNYIASGIYRAFRDYKRSIDNRSGKKSVDKDDTEIADNSDNKGTAGTAEQPSVKPATTGNNTSQQNVAEMKPAGQTAVKPASSGDSKAQAGSSSAKPDSDKVTPSAQNSAAANKPVQNAKPEVREPAKNSASGTDICFMVQIAAAPKNKPLKLTSFRGIDIVSQITDGERIKYSAGRFSVYEDAVNYRRSLTTTYPDAFVIAVRNGKIIPLSEALKELKKN